MRRNPAWMVAALSAVLMSPASAERWSKAELDAAVQAGNAAADEVAIAADSAALGSRDRRLRSGLADGESARFLKETCRMAILSLERNEPANAFWNCFGYVAGVRDAIVITRSSMPIHCRPEQTSELDMARMFVAFVDRHPRYNAGHRFAAMLAALDEAYPCG